MPPTKSGRRVSSFSDGFEGAARLRVALIHLPSTLETGPGRRNLMPKRYPVRLQAIAGFDLAKNLVDDMPPAIQIDAGGNEPDLAHDMRDALFAEFFFV